MQVFTVIFERIPQVWFLLGLLFNATGLYLGFDYKLAFVYMIVGWFCCAYGIAVFVFQLRERPRNSEATRLSPKFISAGSPTANPAPTPAPAEPAAPQDSHRDD
jgi:hypothetical protein